MIVKLPNGWKEYRISRIARIYVDRDLKEDSYSEIRTDTHRYPVYSNTVQNRGLYGFYDFEEYPGKCLTVVGRGAGLGTAFPRASGFGAIGRLLVISPRKNFDTHYLSEYINSKLHIFKENSGIPQLPGEQFGRYKVILPPLHEQIAIADLLSIWDAAIEKIERLIVAKDMWFRGLVQKLVLAPSQIKGHWKHLRISEIAKRIQRRSNGNDFPILTISSSSGFVLQEEKYSRYMAGESVKRYILLRKGEFAYNKGNSLRYQFGCIFKLKAYDEALVPHVYVCFKLNSRIDSDYMEHLFHADYLKRQLGRIVKTGVRNNGLLNIKPDEFMNVTVPVPPFDQQKQIASTLNTARREIVLLNKQAEAFRKQKRGLMQKLLTGQWGVKLNKEPQ
jgi:restriction endonuclease S subunit